MVKFQKFIEYLLSLFTIQQVFLSFYVKPITLSLTIFQIFTKIDQNLTKNYERCEFNESVANVHKI